MEESQHILDAPERPKKPARYLGMGYAGIALLAAGVGMQWLHFNGWIWAVLAGVTLMTIRGAMIYLNKHQPLHSKIFFLGRAWLIAGLLVMMWKDYSMWFLFTPAVLLMAIAWYMELRLPPSQRTDDDPEFD